jgi:hypothetical protein
LSSSISEIFYVDLIINFKLKLQWKILKNLILKQQLQKGKNMVADGADDFTECGPGAVLQGLIKKIDGSVNAHGIA